LYLYVKIKKIVTMSTNRLLLELDRREKELNEELLIIRKMKDMYKPAPEEKSRVTHRSRITSASPGRRKARRISISSVPGAKGKRSWADYTLALLRESGGKAKVAILVERATGENPGLDPFTVKNAITHALSALYRKKVVEATKGNYQKEGYLYGIIEG
jgi:UDP-N-acetylmuramyl tripeptide synthase